MKHFYFILFCILFVSEGLAQRFSLKIYSIADGLQQSEVGQPKILYDGTVVIPQLSGQLQKFDGYKFEVVPNVLMSGCCTGGFANLKNYTFLRDGSRNQVYSKGVFTLVDNKFLPPTPHLNQQEHVYYANDTIWSYGNKILYHFDLNKMSFVKSSHQLDISRMPAQFQSFPFLKESKDRRIIYNYNELYAYDKLSNTIYKGSGDAIEGIAKSQFSQVDPKIAFAQFYNFSDAETRNNILNLNRGELPSLICDYDFDTLYALGLTISKGGVSKINNQLLLQGGHQGLIRINPNIHYIPSSEPNMVKSLHSIFEIQNKIWFGGYGYGFSKYENYQVEREKKFANFSVMPGSITHSNGNAYFMVDSHEAALYSFVKHSKSTPKIRKIISETGYILKELKNNGLAMGSNDYRIYFWPNIDEPNTYKVITKEKGNLHSITLALEQDNAGKLWFFGKGLGIYDPSNDTIFYFQSGEKDANIFGGYSMVLDNRGTMWFGTKNGIYYLKNASNLDLHKIDLKSTLQKINLPNGINDIVMSALQVDNYIVMGSGTSVSFIDLKSFYAKPKNPIIYQLIYGEDIEGGGSEQNCILFDSQRRLWIGAQEGALMIDWDKFKFDNSKSKIKVHLFQTGNDTITLKTNYGIELAPEKRNIKIEFGLDKNTSLLKNVFFDYTLISENNDTLENIKYDQNGKLEIKYLPPGHYTLNIIARKNGQWMDEMTIQIHARQSMAENPIFWVSLFVITLLFSIGFLWYRHKARNAVLKRELRLSQLTSEKHQLKIQSIISSFNPHFINNSLHWIQSRHMDDHDTVNLVGDLSENIRYIFDTTKTGRATHSLKNEMKLVNNYVNIQLLRFANSFSFIQPSVEELKQIENHEIIVMQLQIHVENAIEHGLRNRKKSSYVKLSINETEKEIIFTIEDDGGGRNYSKKIKSTGTQRGSQMLKELHEIFNEVNDQKITTLYEDEIFHAGEERFGTRVIITIPKQYKYQIKESL